MTVRIVGGGAGERSKVQARGTGEIKKRTWTSQGVGSPPRISPLQKLLFFLSKQKRKTSKERERMGAARAIRRRVVYGTQERMKIVVPRGRRFTRGRKVKS